MRETVMMKNVMEMSQILTQIECFTGKKENLIKKFKYIHQKYPPPFSKLAEIAANIFCVFEPSKMSDFIAKNIVFY